MIETAIIIAVVGILTVLAAPSFGGMLDSIAVNHSVSKMRVSLDQAHRQAIRTQDICEAAISTNQYSTASGQNAVPSTIHLDCLPKEEETFSNKVVLATNMLPLKQISSSTVPEPTTLEKKVADWCDKHKDHNHKDWFGICSAPPAPEDEPQKLAQIAFGKQGNIKFDVKSDPETTLDHSGKLVLYRRENKSATKKCIVISKRLGLTRFGSYAGELDAIGISNGKCTAQDWKKQ